MSDVNEKVLELFARVLSDLGEIKETAAENTQSLKEHMRRTEAVEKLVEKQDARLKPLETNAAMWSGVNKALVVLGAIVGLVAGVFKLVN